MRLPAAYATEVFLTQDIDLDRGDYVCIVQHQEDEFSSRVFLNRDQARLVATEIMRLDSDDGAWLAKQSRDSV
jgi:hypothetical protein